MRKQLGARRTRFGPFQKIENGAGTDAFWTLFLGSRAASRAQWDGDQCTRSRNSGGLWSGPDCPAMEYGPKKSSFKWCVQNVFTFRPAGRLGGRTGFQVAVAHVLLCRPAGRKNVLGIAFGFPPRQTGGRRQWEMWEGGLRGSRSAAHSWFARFRVWRGKKKPPPGGTSRP